MEFTKYQHVERFGTVEVEGIELGECLVFPKLDGSNGSVWRDERGQVQAGSRRRVLSLDDDNGGFYAYVQGHEGIRALLHDKPDWYLYGEWLIPHSLKTYKEDAWRKFYVFDIIREGGEGCYVPYDVYRDALEHCGIDYVPVIGKVSNGSEETFQRLIQQNTFLIEEGKGIGEGIVIKRYDYINRYGRTTWAKMVTNEFKEKHVKEMGAPEIKGPQLVEQKIVDDYCTEAFIEKEYAKIVNEHEGWSSQFIPQLLGRVFHELVTEEIWNIVKTMKQPTVNFKALNTLVVGKVKQVKPELF